MLYLCLTTIYMNLNMTKTLRIMAAAVLGAAAVSCASPSKMAQLADNVKVTTDPQVLEVVAGEIDADVAVTYPADYFLPKAILEVTPVLVYDGGEAKAQPLMYQGEKVKDNYRTVSSEGGTVRSRVHFDYEPGMEQAELVLRGVVKYKGKSYNLPEKKAADGCNTTYMLVSFGHENGSAMSVPLKDDNYQPIIEQTEEGQILYKINSSNVDKKQLSSQSVKDFQAALDEIASNARKTLKGTEVVAYASPDGKEALNNKLSENRSKTADDAFQKVTKGKETGDVSVKSIGEDWEGFQELVAASDIQDTDLILRVLSMYSDPAVRESEIRNMSEIFTSLKSTILPELRRARFIANVEYKNYTDDELKQMIEDNADVLDETALLHAATLIDDNDEKVSLYNKAIDKYDSDRARFNKGVVLLSEGKTAQARKAFESVKTEDEELKNALGAVAYEEGDISAATKYFKEADTETSRANQGVIDILSGNYKAAAKDFAGQTGKNAALANILNNDLASAEKAITCNCPMMGYLKAIIAARRGDAQGVSDNLKVAGKMDKLAKRAEKDVEFADYR